MKKLKLLFSLKIDPKDSSLYQEALLRGYEVDNMNWPDFNYDSVWFKIYTFIKNIFDGLFYKIFNEKINNIRSDERYEVENNLFNYYQPLIEQAYKDGFKDGQNNNYCFDEMKY